MNSTVDKYCAYNKDMTSPKRLAVAPMMDWTDRHCRTFHRGLSRHAVLYSEMVTTGALIYGDQARHLDYSACEHPVVLQLGGSEPHDLAACVKLAEQWGYDEVDLNCGCPSERVQRGSFGACLMAEPQLVADCVKAMVDVANRPITVKHRLGLNEMDAQGQVADYQWVLDFMCQVAQAGPTQLTIHARNAVLKGLSPKENREVPPLRYDIAKRLRQDVQRHFPHVRILLNGGLASNHDIVRYWHDFDGFMVGRAAYHTPAMLLDWDRLITSDATEMGHFFGAEDWLRITEALIAQAIDWREHCMKAGRPFHLAAITRHILGLAHGKGGSRYWRRQLSDYAQLAEVQSDEQIREFFVRANQQLRIVVEEEDADRV